MALPMHPLLGLYGELRGHKASRLETTHPSPLWIEFESHGRSYQLLKEAYLFILRNILFL